MRIESGPTGERRTRVAIFFLVCIGLSAWFAYDGWWGYPAKNLAWARQAMPAKLPTLWANPRVTTANLSQVAERSAAGQPMSRDELDALLGVPALELMRELRFVGSELAAVVRMDDGKVHSVWTEQVPPSQKPPAPNYRVVAGVVQEVQPGMSEQQVRRMLGEPTQVQEKTRWYVGPGAYAQVQVDGGKAVGAPVIAKATEPSEGDIFIQRILAGVLAGLAVVMGIQLYRVATLRAVLDDAGLTFNRTHVAWEAMTGLNCDQYQNKGWLDLLYRAGEATRRLRLDSYHLARFREITQALCQRKGFSLPEAASPPDAPPAP